MGNLVMAINPAHCIKHGKLKLNTALVSYRVFHNTGELKILAKSQVLYIIIIKNIININWTHGNFPDF